MKKLLIELMEKSLFINKEIEKGNTKYWKKIKILSYTELDDRFVIIKTDHINKYKTFDKNNNKSLPVESSNRDYQIIYTLGYKYEVGDQFAYFISKILGIR